MSYSNEWQDLSFAQFVEHARSTEGRPDHLLIDRESMRKMIEVASTAAALIDLYKTSLYTQLPIEESEFAARLERTQRALSKIRINSASDHFIGTNDRLLLALLGIFTEAGELLEIFTESSAETIDFTCLREELGDLNWYQAIVLDEVDTRFEAILAMNAAKLRARYGSKFTVERSLHRDLNTERAAMAAADPNHEAAFHHND